MMKQVVCAVFVVMSLFVAGGAAPARAQMPGGGDGGPALRDNREFSSGQFSDRKARVLSMIEERRKRLAEEKSCVEAATTDDELRACRPRPPFERGRGGQGGQGRQPLQSPPDEAR